MPKRNNTNQPVSDSLRRFSADTTCQYVYHCLRRLREKSSSNSSLTGGTVPRRRFCCDKETGAANTWAVLARRMMQSRRKSVPPDLLRVILLWHSDAACRPAGLRLRKRCRHFAVPSPLGAPYDSCRVYQTPKRFSPQGFLFSEQESYPTPGRKDIAKSRDGIDTVSEWCYYSC